MYTIHRELADNEGERERAGGHGGGMRAKALGARDMASVQYNYVSRATRELGSEGTRFQQGGLRVSCQFAVFEHIMKRKRG